MIKRYELDETDVRAAIDRYMRDAHSVDPTVIKIQMSEEYVGYPEAKQTVLRVIVEVNA